MASSIQNTISRRSLKSLHASMARAAGSFGTYNFREYFLRIADRKFGEELPAILGNQGGSSKLSFPPAHSIYSSLSSSQASSSSSSNTSSSASASQSTPGEDDVDLLSTLPQEQQERLKEWWSKANHDLEVWKRSSIVNNLYEAPPLVVEGQGNITVQGGGGAGMEAR